MEGKQTDRHVQEVMEIIELRMKVAKQELLIKEIRKMVNGTYPCSQKHLARILSLLD